jgi:Bacterial SH3 domain
VWKGCRVLSAGCRKQSISLARRLSRGATRWAVLVGLGMAIAACPQLFPNEPQPPATSSSYSSLGRALDACGDEIASTLLQPRSQLQIQDFDAQSDGSLTLRWRLNPTREVICQVSSTGQVLSIQERAAQAEPKPEDPEDPEDPGEPQEPVETGEFSEEIRPRRVVRRQSVEVVDVPAPRHQPPSRPKPEPPPDRPVRPTRPPQAAVLTASDPSQQINVYSQPSFQSDSPHYGLAGDRITLLSETTGDDGYLWYYVRFESGAEGWVRSDFVSFSVIPTPPRFPDVALLSCEDRILAELPSLSKDYVYVFPDGNSGDTFYMKWQVSTGAYGVCTSDRFGNLLDYVNLNQQTQPLEPPPDAEGL